MKAIRTEAQRRAWGKYLLRLRKRHDERRKVAWIKSLYEEGILPKKK
jgi:hypothetical protein